MSRILKMLQEEKKDYHPLVSILKIAHKSDADLRLQYDCHKTIAKYVEAERRSVDIKTDDGSELISLNINVT